MIRNAMHMLNTELLTSCTVATAHPMHTSTTFTIPAASQSHLIQVPLQMNSQHWDAQHRLVNFDQLVLQLTAFAHQHPSCKPQIAVKPCVPKATTVCLNVDRLAATAAGLADGLDLQHV
jgi:autotransporter translocation and assembly factor TamB